MKKFILISLLAFFALSLNTAFAQNDSIYVMKNGSIIWEYKIADIDSIVFYKPVIEEETSGTFVDSRDDTEYSWVKIGEQTWMAENLKYLPSVVGPGAGSYDNPYYYVYGYYDTSVSSAKATENYQTYGVLYNWSAAMQACPSGWHLPSDAEWTQLEGYLGENAGGKLKEAGYDHWLSPNEGANNESGFTALPGGDRYNGGNFYGLGFNGYWWSASEDDSNYAWGRNLYYNGSNNNRFSYYLENGFSVRCVRD